MLSSTKRVEKSNYLKLHDVICENSAFSGNIQHFVESFNQAYHVTSAIGKMINNIVNFGMYMSGLLILACLLETRLHAKSRCAGA